jgi:hypothetical protein
MIFSESLADYFVAKAQARQSRELQKALVG